MVSEQKKQYEHLVKVLPLHLLIWCLLLLVNFFFLKNYRITFDPAYHAFIWSIYLVVFYVNYIWLMPYFFFRRKILLYVSLSLMLLSGSLLVRNQLDMNHFEKIFKDDEEFRGKQHEPFKSREMDHPPFDKRMPPPKGGMPKGKPMPHFSFYSLILFYLAGISLRFVQKWQDDEKRNREIERENISTELSFLKQQVNPHFLFNALNSIYSLTLSTSKPASYAILKLSAILRYMLYETEHKTVSVMDEITIIGDYIDLQRMRLPETVKVNYNFMGDMTRYKIAPLLLLPIVENAFKHGVDNVKPSSIDIMIATSEDRLEMQVKNRIVAKPHTEGTDSGIGLKNIRRRLDLLYHDRFYFDIEQSGDFFTVTLQIKLNE
jgi:two-component system, LytTR family, sensor kinase